MLWAALHFPSLPPEALAPIAAWACQFTPRVSLEPPQELLLEVEGSLRLFGGFDLLRQKLAAGLEALGYPFALATAPTARAALWRARGGGAAFGSLPIEVTRFDTGFLASIGIATVGELIQLPRDGLALRCEPRVLAELDQALGAAPEPRAFFVPQPCFRAALELPAAVAHAEGLLFGARRLLVQLEGLLAARQEGTRSFTLVLDGATKLEIGLASPARDAERFAQLLRERLAKLVLSQPVEAIRLEADGFVALAGRSAGMFGDSAAEAEDWARLVERLRARLGHDAVCGLAPQPDHRPEHAWRRIEPGEWDPREFRVPGPRPLWLLEKQKKLREGEFTPLAGPERIESGWWDGDDAKRDYFVARLPNAALAWVYREAGEWYLHGLFA
ncbi:MAG TPA: DNA polymerase Y family protein [Burkholderiales bacterium]|nr:DNA polymerase Y family protein [Burkholderiales bacterium]